MRTPVVLYIVAVVVRVALLAHFPDPAYPDSFYYVDVARSLAAGHGFNVDVVWIFAEVGGRLPDVPVLPIPSNAHWMPLASIVQVPFIWLLGPTAIASALPFALLGGFAAPLTWAIARDAGAKPLVAGGAGLLAAFPALLTVFLAQPDNFGLYEPLIAGALWFGARGLRGDHRAFAAAGLLVGVATLSRNDGVLALAALGLVFGGDRWRAWRSGGSRRPAIPLWAAVACAGIALVVVAPWLLRQLSVFGSISPSTASGKVLYIRSIDEWNSITTPATLDHLLGMGLGPLLASRLGGLIAAIGIFSVLAGGAVLVPFMAIGAWRRRRSPDFVPFLTYAAILFAFSGLVSAVHVPGGTFIHSAVALVPHASILALEGVLACVGWVASRRRRWDPVAAGRVFVGAAVVFAGVTAFASALTTHGVWAARRDQKAAVAAALDAAGAPATDRLMSIDAAGYRYATGRGGVVLVNDPLATIEQVARAYGIRWLVLERDEAVPAAAPILRGESRPAWLGPPILTFGGTPTAGAAGAPGEPGSTTPTAGAGEPPAAPVTAAPTTGEPAVALYPVCFAAGDPRCPSGASP